MRTTPLLGQRELAAERGVRAETPFQPKKRPRPGQPLIAEAFVVSPAIGFGDRAAQRDDHQVEQSLDPRPRHPRIG
jgi:hypothetical protein